MKNVAIISNSESERINRLIEFIKDEYNVTTVYGQKNALDLLNSDFENISVLIIDNPFSFENVSEILSFVKNTNNFMFSLPVLVLTDDKNVDKDDKYLVDPVIGAITSSDTKNIVLSRINNAVKLANSTSFDDFSDILTALPSLIYLKDAKGRYAFCSQDWRHLADPNDTVRGKTDPEIRKHKRNTKLAHKSDMEVIRTGKGTSYTIREGGINGTKDYLQIIKEPIFDNNKEVIGIVGIVNNITSQEVARRELRAKSITDQLTGVYNRVFFEELTQQGKNGLNFPLTMITADCDGLKDINDRFGHAAGDQYICYAKAALQNVLPKKSYIFRMGGDEFLAVVPRTNKTIANTYVKKIKAESKKYGNEQFSLKLSVGSYTIERKNDSIESAVIESDKEMYRNKNRRKKAAKK